MYRPAFASQTFVSTVNTKNNSVYIQFLVRTVGKGTFCINLEKNVSAVSSKIYLVLSEVFWYNTLSEVSPCFI